MSDGGGLFLWVTPAGGKLWRWKYRHEGHEKLMSFGKYPDVPLALARERHAEARKLLAGGLDPMGQRKTEKTAERVASGEFLPSVAALWLDHWKTGKARGMWTLPGGGWRPTSSQSRERPNSEIEAPELVAMVKAIEARGAGDIAKRAMENTGQIFRYAIAHGYAKRNPASEIRPVTF